MVRQGLQSLNGMTRKAAMLEMVKRISKYRDAELFLYPVDHVGMGLSDYPQIIKHPMDLETLMNNLQADDYENNEDRFWADLELIWANCELYNGASSIYGRAAQKMRELTRKQEELYKNREKKEKLLTKSIKEETKMSSQVSQESGTSPASHGSNVGVPRSNSATGSQVRLSTPVKVQSDKIVSPPKNLPPPPSDPKIASVAAAVCARILQLNEIAIALIMKYLCSLQSARGGNNADSCLIRPNTQEERDVFPAEFQNDPRESVRLDLSQLNLKELKSLYLLVERLVDGGCSRI